MAAIDVGSAATDRADYAAIQDTWVDKANPANDDGSISSVEIWLKDVAGVNVYAGMFSASGNVLQNIARPKGTEFYLEQMNPIYTTPMGKALITRPDIGAIRVSKELSFKRIPLIIVMKYLAGIILAAH